MEPKPIFVIYLPVGNMQSLEVSDFINKCMDDVRKEIHGWTVLIAPSRSAEDIRFEAFHVNNLKPLQQQQLNSIQKTVEDFVRNAKNEN